MANALLRKNNPQGILGVDEKGFLFVGFSTLFSIGFCFTCLV